MSGFGMLDFFALYCIEYNGQRPTQKPSVPCIMYPSQVVNVQCQEILHKRRAHACFH
jgi:hypothetical protein